MDSDKQTISAAYDDMIKKLYWALFDQYAEAAGDATQEQQAEQHFAVGIALARRARDRAFTLSA